MPIPKEFRVRMQGPADLQIGKAGLSDGAVNQLVKLLKRHRLIKTRVLKNVPGDEEIKTIAEKAAHATDSQIGLIRGRCFILFKKDWRRQLHRSLASTQSRRQ
ncbi:MAG: YhbY family RNA-binding protein [Candidatus Ranarchaeia archaeon]